MHAFNNGLALVILLASPATVAAQAFVVKPGRIEAPRDAPAAQAAGTFSLHAARHGSSNRSGGACLVFQPVAGAHACSSDADCTVRAAALFPAPQSSAGYCAGDGGQARQCWYRPPDPVVGVDARGLAVSRHCVKSGNAPLPLDTSIALAPVSAFPLGAQPTRWRVTTCHNLLPPPDATGRPACARSESVEGRDKATRFGPAKRFRP